MASQNGLSIPLKGKLVGTSKSFNGLSFPLSDLIAGTDKAFKGLSVPIRQYCIRVVDQSSNPIENAILTISEGLPSEQYTSDADGFIYVFIKSGNATAQKAGFEDGTLSYNFEGVEDDCIDIVLSSITGLSTQLESVTLPSFKAIASNDFCYCAVECDYIEYAFALAGGEDYKNDKASFLFQKIVPSDSIVFELHKKGVKVADLNDDTFGTYYDGFAVKPLYQGFVLEWEKVIDLLGTGLYQVKTVRTLLGNSDVIESNFYRLYPYSDEIADKTVKIVGIQTGNIKGNSLDFTGLLPQGWAYYTRVRGFLKEVNPTYEQDNYLDSQDRRLQIQDKIIHNYELSIHQAPSSIIRMFLDGFISLANDIKVTDYNLFNTSIYRDVSLYTQDFSYEPIMGQRLQDLTMQFSDRNESIYKRNF